MVTEVWLWGRRIGVAALDDSPVASFEYVPEFVGSGIEVSPLKMPLDAHIYRFAELPDATFHGLPGMLADSLPDRFGNALIDAWLVRQGRRPETFNALERLCYIGKRGMGALEYRPAHGPRQTKASEIDIGELAALAAEVLARREDLEVNLGPDTREEALRDILRVGTSAGGARAKAIIAWNPQTNEVRSGQVPSDPGFEYWLLKFDGVNAKVDKDMRDPEGYGAIEYGYFLMARAAGIMMTECRLLEENGRRHFMTRRFDRLANGEKLHMQSLGALAHFDYNLPGAYSYEQAFSVIRDLGLSMEALEEQYRRMVFNIVARNQDDHVKNIAFIMNKAGEWSLAPAYDMTYSNSPGNQWLHAHQMTMNGKREDFALEDFTQCARNVGLKRGRHKAILAEVQDAVRCWPEFAEKAKVSEERANIIRGALHLQFPGKG